MAVEFISLSYPNASTDLQPSPRSPLDPDFFARYARTVEEAGFDYTLLPYNSATFDPLTRAAVVGQVTETLTPIVALRTNAMHPTYAARALATLDQLNGGRVVAHFVSGASSEEQAREGDHLSKPERYRRLDEYLGILRHAWTTDSAFDHDGDFYGFEKFSNWVRPTNGTIPISVGGSSSNAYNVGGRHADIFGLWGEPLRDTAEQIESIRAAAGSAGRVDAPRIWVTFRPIIADTDARAWEKAERILRTLEANSRRRVDTRGALHPEEIRHPENTGAQRTLAIAARGDRHDRALWTAPAKATNARGASTALVGSPETVAAAILDYIDLGASLISIRGYDNINDVEDYGRRLLPLVKNELAHRAATGERGRIVEQPPLTDKARRSEPDQ